MIAVLGLGIATAAAGSWEPGEARALAADGGVTGALVGRFDGGAALIVGGPDGVSVRTGAALGEVAALALPVAALHMADLDGDRTMEALVCGPSGLHVLRVTSDVFAEPIALSDVPCASIASFTPAPPDGLPPLDHLVTWTGEGLKRWQPGGDGLIAEDVALPEGFGAVLGLAGNGPAWAALGASWFVERGGVRTVNALTTPATGITADGEGFALAFASAEGGRIVRADGSELPLPGVPRWLASPELAGEADLLVGLPDRTVGMLLGDGAFTTAAMPARGDVVASGDLDGDGCPELVGLAADGSEGAVLAGVCAAALPEGTLTLGAEWAQLSVTVGTSARVQLVDGLGGWTGFERRGGPDGVLIRPDGVLEFTPTSEDVGIWRVSVRITDGTQERWSGLVLRVRGDTSAPAPVRLPDAMATAKVTEPGDRNNVVAASRRTGFLGFKECMASAGAAVGASRNQGTAWSNIGLPPVVPSASPAVTFACGRGSPKVHLLVGVDSAPTFFYLAKNGRMNHVLAGTIGLELRPGNVRFGPIVNAGLLVLGGGVRFAWVPFQTKQGGRHGIEARAIAYPANISGQALLAYTWQFGNL